jgi:CheY-like chemotaxis protein
VLQAAVTIMKRTILLADNDSDYLRTTRALLELEGYPVVSAGNATEARRALEEGGMDIAILDLRLDDDTDYRDTSGLMVAKDDDSAIPKIILTSYATAESLREALGPQVDRLTAAVGIVLKDEGFDGLLRAVRKVQRTLSNDLVKAVSSLTSSLEDDYQRARAEARLHFRLGLAISFACAMPLILGVLMAMTNRLAVGLASAAGGIALQVSNYLFFSKVDMVGRLTERYLQERLQSWRVETLLTTCAQIPDPNVRDTSTLDTIRAAAWTWLVASDSQRRPYQDKVSYLNGQQNDLEHAQADTPFVRLDKDLLDGLEKRIVAHLEEFLAGPVLENYRGFLCASLVDAAGTPVKLVPEEVSAVLGPGHYQLEVWLQPLELEDGNSFRSEIVISDGRDAAEVEFEVVIDSDPLTFIPSHKTIRAPMNKPSARLAFPFSIQDTSPTDTSSIWVQLFQKSRIIQVVNLHLREHG